MSTGLVRTKDMAVVGVIVGAIGWTLFVLIAPWLWKLLGLLPS